MHLSTDATKPSVLHGHDHSSTTPCKNCGNRFEGRFCNACGQRADIHRINWHYIWHEIPHSVWHVDHGMLFTLKELLTRPGHTIREFLEGKRVKHYRPLALILILGGMYAFFLHSLNIHLAELGQNSFGIDIKSTGSVPLQQFSLRVNQFIEKYQNLIQVVLLPLASLYTWLFFRRKGLNYPEHLVVNTFLANISLVFSILGILVFTASSRSATAFSFTMLVINLLSLGFRCWAYAQLFRGKLRPFNAGLRAAAATLCSFLTFMLIVGLLSMGYFYIIKNELFH